MSNSESIYVYLFAKRKKTYTRFQRIDTMNLTRLAFTHKPHHHHKKVITTTTTAYDDTATIIFAIETAVCLQLQMLGVFLLFKMRRKRILDLFLLHLLLVQMLVALVNILLFVRLHHARTEYELGLGATLGLAHILSLIAITIDRLLAVKLDDKYPLVLTHGKFQKILLLIWAASISYGVIITFTGSTLARHMQVGFDVVLVVFFTVADSYVVFQVKVAKQTFTQVTNEILENPPQRKYHYRVPLVTVIIYFYFYFIPNLTIPAGVAVSNWHFVVWTANNMLDSIVYIFGFKRLRNSLRRNIAT